LNHSVFFRVKGLEEEIEKLNGQLDEKKEQIATWEKSIETMKAKNNVCV
jgi:peptidoglycan hydrolase CwlO-like protein